MYTRTITLSCLLFNYYFPLLFFSCPGNNSKSFEGTLLKFQKMMKNIEGKCKVQEP